MTYEVKVIQNCRLIFGEVPLSDMAGLLRSFGKNAIMDINLAKRVGALMVIGAPEDIQALWAMNLPPSAANQAEHDNLMKQGFPRVAHWLLHGERGLSSEAMCKALYGVPACARQDHPRDGDDFRRCVLFLDQTESRSDPNLWKQLRALSAEWAALVAHWAEIETLLKDDLAKNGHRCSQAIRALLQEAQASRP